jgi:hypothetical protein
MRTFLKRALVVAVCSLLGGLSSCGMGASAGAPIAEMSRSFGVLVAVLFGWFAGAVVSVVTAAVWLRTDVAGVVRSVWWIYVATACVGLYGCVATLGTGWRTVWFALFSGAWTSAAFAVGTIAWTKARGGASRP